MTFAIVRSDKEMTARDRLKAGRAPGRRSGRLPGGHIDDRAALRKAISLCIDCEPKFNRAAYDYTTKPNLPLVRGRCDGCMTYSPSMRLLVHHTLVSNI